MDKGNSKKSSQNKKSGNTTTDCKNVKTDNCKSSKGGSNYEG